MFDSGFSELMLIMVVALVVVGPERLPGLARKIGYWVGRFRRYANNVRAEIEREINADELRSMLSRQEDEIRELRDMLQDTRDQMRVEVDDIANSLHKTSDNADQHDDLTDAQSQHSEDTERFADSHEVLEDPVGQTQEKDVLSVAPAKAGHQAEKVTDDLSIDKTTHGRKSR